MIEITQIGPMWTPAVSAPDEPGCYSVIRNYAGKNFLHGGRWDGKKWLNSCCLEIDDITHWAPLTPVCAPNQRNNNLY